MDSILKITKSITGDTSIDKYEYFEYGTIVGTNLNNSGGDIRITIETQDIFTHPSESILIIEGQLTKDDDTLYADADVIFLTNNGMMYLFKNIKYQLSEKTIEEVQYPGQATTMLGLLKYTDDFSKSHGIKDDDTLYADADVIFLTNNGMMYLFKNIKYQLSEKTIEEVQYPGQATTMLGLLKYTDDFSKSHGINQLWYKDTATAADLGTNVGFKIRKEYIINKPDSNGTFSFKIPLKHIFGFCEDYNKILYGMKQNLTFTRNNDNDAIFRVNAAANGKIRLDSISWCMPHVMPADKDKMELYRIIEGKETLPVGYRKITCSNALVPQTTSFTWDLPGNQSTEVPSFIIVGFQTNKSNNQRQNASIFNNVGVNNIYVTLNSRKYPENDYNISFPKQKISMVIQRYLGLSFFNMDVLVSNFNFTPFTSILYLLLMFPSKAKG